MKQTLYPTHKSHLTRFSLISLVLLAGAVAGCGRINAKSTAIQDGPVEVPVPTPSPLLLEGRLEPNQSAWLSFQAAGPVVEILVEEGQMVQAGDPLIRLGSPETYQAALQDTNLELINAQQALTDLDRQAELAYAQALEEVTTTMDDLDEQKRIHDRLPYAHGSTEQIAAAQANYTLAQDKVDKLEHIYDNTLDRPEDDVKRALALANLENAKNERDRALINLNWYKGIADDQEVAEKDANLAQAQASYDLAVETAIRLKDGADPEQNTLLIARIEAAQAHVNAAQSNLDALTLTAPFAGTVTTISVTTGETVTTTQKVLQLADFSNWVIETNDLDEIKVVGLSIGQAAHITLDALPEVNLDGIVKEISQDYTEESGDVLYTARINLSAAEEPRLRWGMTASIGLEE